MTHDEVVRQSKTGGNTVHFVIRRFQPSSQFMTLQGGNMERRRGTALCHNVTETQWCTVISVPLKYAYVARSLTLRNVLEVFALDGHSTSPLVCLNSSVAEEWSRCIKNNINLITRASLVEINAGLPANGKVYFVTWLWEKVVSKQKCSWVPRFFALRGDTAYLFDVPPVYVHDWCRPVNNLYKVYECYCQVPTDTTSSADCRPNCVYLYTGSDKPKTLALETPDDVHQFIETWKQVSYTAVKHIAKRARYTCTSEKNASIFFIDFEQETFTLKTSAMVMTDRKNSTVPASSPQSDPDFVWQYKFSQLRSSADDGHRILKLHFASAESPAYSAAREPQSRVEELLNDEIDLIQFDEPPRADNDDDEGFLSMGASSHNGHNGHNGLNGHSNGTNRQPNNNNNSSNNNNNNNVEAAASLIEDLRHGALIIETRTIESGNMRLMMNALHAFLEAKLVDLDPEFFIEALQQSAGETDASSSWLVPKDFSFCSGITLPILRLPENLVKNTNIVLQPKKPQKCEKHDAEKPAEKPVAKKEMRDEAVNTDFVFSMRGFW